MCLQQSSLIFNRGLENQNLLQPRPGERHKVRNAGFRVEAAAHPIDQNFHAIPSCNESGYHCLRALEWALGNLGILTRPQSLIELYEFILAHAGFQFADEFSRQKAEAIPEMHEAANAGTLSHSPMKS